MSPDFENFGFLVQLFLAGHWTEETLLEHPVGCRLIASSPGSRFGSKFL